MAKPNHSALDDVKSTTGYHAVAVRRLFDDIYLAVNPRSIKSSKRMP
jgi:hypothetical protein